MNWTVKNNNGALNQRYQTLQAAARQTQDAVQSFGNDSDLILTEAEIKKWNGAHPENKLFFTHTANNAETLRVDAAQELEAFYGGLVLLDQADGKLDGTIASQKEFLEVPHFENPLARRLGIYRKSIFSVLVTPKSGKSWSGTAWIFDRKKLTENKWEYFLMSVAHTVDGELDETPSYFVRNAAETEPYPAKRVGTRRATDTGIISFESTEEFLPLPYDASPSVQDGNTVIVIGNQLGEGIDYTEGQINAHQTTSLSLSFTVVQHDTNTAGGNSGSPVFNKKGFVVGVHAAGSDGTTRASNGFFVPMDIALESYESIMAQKPLMRSNGLQCNYRTLSPDEINLLGLNTKSAYYVHSVVAGSNAEKAGLKPGHILLAINETAVPMKDWQKSDQILFDMKPGTKTTLTVTTVAEPQKLTVLKYEPVSE